ncbi:MAG: Hpt domain-containing protein, partial [Gammaproteobacteria bacterium]|nr:Hpt domain-containing protein [Gammaproteobacteria bacterium]
VEDSTQVEDSIQVEDSTQVEDSIQVEDSTQAEGSTLVDDSLVVTELSSEEDEEEMDPVLLEIFTNEAQSHVKNIEQCIEECHMLDDVCPPNDLLIRSLHTLRGSAHMANIHAIGNVSEQMEKTVKVIAEKGQKLDSEHIQMLEELCQFSSTVLDKLNESTNIPEENLALQSRIIEKYEQALHLENLLDVLEVSEEVSISEERLEIEDDDIDSSELLDIDQLEGIENVESLEEAEDSMLLEDSELTEGSETDESFEQVEDADTTEESDEEQINSIDEVSEDFVAATEEETAVEPLNSTEEYDDELLQIFVEEGEELLDSSEQALHKLKEDPNDAQALNRLLRDMHTLKGGARMAGVTAIGDLTHSFESKLDQFTQGEMTFSNSQIELLLHVQDALSSMVENLKNNQRVESHLELITQLDNISEETSGGVVETETVLDVSVEENQLLSDELTIDSSDDEELQSKGEPLANEESSADEESLIEDPYSSDASPEELNIDQPDAEHEEESEASAEVYDDELMEIFLEEAHELMESSDTALSHLKREPDNSEQLSQLLRDLHTIKGGARMAGITPIGDLTHSLETQLEQITDLNQTPSKQFFELLHQAHDTLNDMLDDLKAGKSVRSADALISLAEDIKQGKAIDEEDKSDSEDKVVSESVEQTNELDDSQSEEQDESQSKDFDEDHVTGDSFEQEVSLESETSDELESKSDLNETSTDTEVDQTVDALEAIENTVQGTEPDELPPENVDLTQTKATPNKTERVRVSADILDELVNYAGEVSIYRSRLNQGSNEFQSSLDEMNTTIIRLREQLRRFEMETEAQIQSRKDQAESLGYERYEEFDPLEFDRFSNMQQITRAMAETVVDLDSIESTMKNLNSEAETLLIQQGRVNTDLQEGLMRTRMVPFKSQLTRLRRIIRQTSKELHKQVNFELYGGDQEIDRRVLEKMMAPLEHMLRNAVAHGIETPEEREKSGKNPIGNIKLMIGRDGSEIDIKVADDGAGVNIDAVRDKAIQQGLMVKNAELTEQDIIQFILESGFSTASEVSQIAGRGVGMDVVNAEIKQLNGTLEIESIEGKGSVFNVLMPLTMSVSRALMVEVGEEIFAIPLVGIENIIRETNNVLEQLIANDDTYYQWHDEQYQFMHLGTALGINSPVLPGEKNKAPILLARSGEHRVALFVDGLMGSREIVVKSVGPQLSTVKGVTGATILGDGKISLILDLGVLAREGARMKVAAEQETTFEATENVIPTVMVVDDSITVRKVTQRLLHRYDYQVITAKDGVDAIATLHETIPDVMLLDVEMPRMDGFELATHMRDDEKFKDIPIIMITSRTGDKHRERAMNIGVNEYMGKPYQEHDLITNIRKLTEA